MATNVRWPSLPLAAWRETCETLYRWMQIVGKLRLALSPPEPEWAHVGLTVTARGLTTGVLAAERVFQVDADFVDHALRVVTSDGETRTLALAPRSVAAYDAEAVARFHAVLLRADQALRAHRAPFRGRHTDVRFFWGRFDLAYARYSGRPAAPPSDDPIMRVAMDAEEVCAGFWPGDDRFAEPAFSCYAYPSPAGFEAAAISAPAFWSTTMREYLLPYEAVRSAPDPETTLRTFFAETFAAASTLAEWDAA